MMLYLGTIGDERRVVATKDNERPAAAIANNQPDDAAVSKTAVAELSSMLTLKHILTIM